MWRRTNSGSCFCFNKTPRYSQAATHSTTEILAGPQPGAASVLARAVTRNMTQSTKKRGEGKKQKHPPSFPAYRLVSAAFLPGPSTGSLPLRSLEGKPEGRCYSVDKGEAGVSAFLSQPWWNAGHSRPYSLKASPCEQPLSYCSPLSVYPGLLSQACVRLFPVLTFDIQKNRSCQADLPPPPPSWLLRNFHLGKRKAWTHDSNLTTGTGAGAKA